MEAFDTWLDPTLSFKDFKRDVLFRNDAVRLFNNVEAHYTTHNGNQLDLIVWSNSGGHDAIRGARVLAVRYGGAGSVDQIGEAEKITGKLLNGTIMTSPVEGKIVITNPVLKTSLTLDFSDPDHPQRIDSQTGESEVAGFHNEVWLDFEYHGPTEGDVYQPFNTLSGAIAGVADGGVIRIVPALPASAIRSEATSASRLRPRSEA